MGQTASYYFDIETTSNDFNAGSVNFHLTSPPDFSPAVTPAQNTSRNISVVKDGSLDFQYTVQITNLSGDLALCDALNLDANVDGDGSEYNGALTAFITTSKLFDFPEDWVFAANLTHSDYFLQNKTCAFDFVFNGVQIGGAGFSDTETIHNTITSGQWQKVVINKVYYDVDGNHGIGSGTDEWKNEWVELYNSDSSPIDISNWQICDNIDCDSIPAGTNPIPANGFAIITGDASTWNYWTIPNDVVKIVLDSAIGNGLSNDQDILLLKDASGNFVDQMNWGVPNTGWANYNSYLWDPGVPDVAEGHMLGRVPTGIDTDLPADWKNLALPQIQVIWPNGGQTLYVGATYNLQWTATNPNGDNGALSIDILYSSTSGSTWANIATGELNDGSYSWKIPLCLNNGSGGCYSTISHNARIKVVAWGPENFMVQAQDMSDSDFCPPVDYSLITDEERAIVDQLLADGVLTDTDVINKSITNNTGGSEDLQITGENQDEEITTEIEDPTGTQETTQEEDIVPQEKTGLVDEVVEEITEYLLDGQTQDDEGDAGDEVEVITSEDTQFISEPSEENTVIEEQPAVEQDAVISVDNNSSDSSDGNNTADTGTSDSGSSDSSSSNGSADSGGGETGTVSE